MTTFRRVLTQCIKLYGGRQQDFAEAVGIRPSMLSKLRAGTIDPSLILLLRMADVCAYPLDDLLRAGGFPSAVPLLHRLQHRAPAAPAPPAEDDLTPYERSRAKKWRGLDDTDQQVLNHVADRLLAAKAATSGKTTSPALRMIK